LCSAKVLVSRGGGDHFFVRGLYPARMSGLKGAFASGGPGLKESKDERRERLELAEMAALAAPPAWAASASLLTELRQKAGSSSNAESVRLSEAPLFGTASTPRAGGGNDVRDAILNARVIARLVIPHDAMRTKQEPDGVWFAVLPPKATGWPSDEVVLCLGMSKGLTLCGAVGSWPKSKFSAKQTLAVNEASRIVLIDDADGAFGALFMGHATVAGVGEDHTRPMPAQQNIHAQVPVHLCEMVHLHLLAKAQVNARLQRGGASDDEKAHVKTLLKQAFTRLQSIVKATPTFADLKAQHVSEWGKVESAYAGLRKAYLPREWYPRCATCGLRHDVVEKGTCKYWVQYVENAQETTPSSPVSKLLGAPMPVSSKDLPTKTQPQTVDTTKGRDADGGQVL
jgi:hypothetical protein